MICMKRIVCFDVLLVLAFIILTFVFSKSNAVEFAEVEFRVPESVRLFLRTSYDHERRPLLELRSFVSGMCDEASDLEFSKTIKEGTMFVSIEGYSYREYVGNFPCGAMVIESTAIIELGDFLDNGGHLIRLKLDDKDNRYRLSKNGHTLRLEPNGVVNVISQESGYGQPEIAQSLEVFLNVE